MAKEKRPTYDRFDVLPLHDVLPVLGGQENYAFLGQVVGTSSLRLLTFKEKGHVCVQCGIEGTHFAIERNYSERGTNKPYHINLYATKPDGTEVLMTCDHIHPKSLGGKNELANTQTMCGPCNWKKGSKVEGVNVKRLQTDEVRAKIGELSWEAKEKGNTTVKEITVGDLLALYRELLEARQEISALNKNYASLRQSNDDLKKNIRGLKKANAPQPVELPKVEPTCVIDRLLPRPFSKWFARCPEQT